MISCYQASVHTCTLITFITKRAKLCVWNHHHKQNTTYYIHCSFATLEPRQLSVEASHNCVFSVDQSSSYKVLVFVEGWCKDFVSEGQWEFSSCPRHTMTLFCSPQQPVERSSFSAHYWIISVPSLYYWVATDNYYKAYMQSYKSCSQNCSRKPLSTILKNCTKARRRVAEHNLMVNGTICMAVMWAVTSV